MTRTCDAENLDLCMGQAQKGDRVKQVNGFTIPPTPSLDEYAYILINWLLVNTIRLRLHTRHNSTSSEQRIHPILAEGP